MFHTTRTSARTMLVAAGTAGFVALGAGIAGADTLGGATDGLPLGDLGGQAPTLLTEGVTSPVGDLAKVEPGEISAEPDLQHHSGPADATDTVGTVVGDGVSAETPIEADEDNATTVGPLDLDETAETLPLSAGSVDPVSDLLGGLGLLDGLGLDSGQTLPMSDSDLSLGLDETASVVDDTATELGGRVDSGVHESNPHLVELDEIDLDQLSGTVPMSDPVGIDTGENADLTGGLTTLLPQDVDETLPMSGADEPDVEGAVEDVTDGAEELGLPPALDETLPMSAVETDVLDGAVDTPGGDLVGVDGLPELGEPEVDTDQLPLADELPVDDAPLLGDEDLLSDAPLLDDEDLLVL
ncbi:hypothetical protein [Nocardiopsis nanhaiensis]